MKVLIDKDDNEPVGITNLTIDEAVREHIKRQGFWDKPYYGDYYGDGKRTLTGREFCEQKVYTNGDFALVELPLLEPLPKPNAGKEYILGPYFVADWKEIGYPETIAICAGSDSIAEATLNPSAAANDKETGINRIIRNTFEHLAHAANCHDELVRSCREMLEAYDPHSEDTVRKFGDNALHSAVKRARAAIAKAEGKEGA